MNKIIEGNKCKEKRPRNTAHAYYSLLECRMSECAAMVRGSIGTADTHNAQLQPFLEVLHIQIPTYSVIFFFLVTNGPTDITTKINGHIAVNNITKQNV
jgi:energy-converting hydrogenase Eha subunit E